MPTEDDKVTAVAVKLPQFWTKNSAAWFAQAEAQFAIRGVTQDDTKYFYVVAALDAETATRASAVLLSPPAADKYETIKSFLLEACELSEAERARQLLSLQEMGDRRPSEIMARILQLNGTNEHHFLLRYIFLNALPVTVRNSLATSKERDLRRLALEADLCHAVTGIQQQTLFEADELEASAVSGKSSRRQLCYWHRKFRKSAKRCEQPCDWREIPPQQTSGNFQGGPH